MTPLHPVDWTASLGGFDWSTVPLPDCRLCAWVNSICEPRGLTSHLRIQLQDILRETCVFGFRQIKCPVEFPVAGFCDYTVLRRQFWWQTQSLPPRHIHDTETRSAQFGLLSSGLQLRVRTSLLLPSSAPGGAPVPLSDRVF